MAPVGVLRWSMSATPSLESAAEERDEGDSVAAAFDNAPLLEPMPAMIRALAELSYDEREALFTPHDEVMRRFREHHGRK